MKSVRQWINPAVLSMQAYHVPSSAGMIKLDAMENPYDWPEDLKQKWLQELKHISVNRYPDPSATLLKDKLRAVMQIPDHISIMPGNGSDELIQIVAMAVAGPGRSILSPEPGFVMYRLISQMTGTRFSGVQLKADDFSLEPGAMLAEIDKQQPALIFIAYPNNPTGNLFETKTLLDVIEQAPGLVVIDEAYHAFAQASFLQYLDKFDNLLVMRTLSKSGLAGIRLGYLLGRQDIISELEKIRLPYNINVLTQKTAEFILSHNEILAEQAGEIRRQREQLYQQLCRIDGIRAWPSAANFILFRTQDMDANCVFTSLKEQGVLIKNLHGSHPLLQKCLRVTAGTAEENTIFMEKLLQVIKNC